APGFLVAGLGEMDRPIRRRRGARAPPRRRQIASDRRRSGLLREAARRGLILVNQRRGALLWTKKSAFPAKAGIHFPTAPSPDEWIPAFAGNADFSCLCDRTRNSE